MKTITKRQWYVWGGIILAVGILFGNRGFRKMVVKYGESKRLEKQLHTLRKEHQRLVQELGWIQKDPSYSEYLIRKHLGYVKKGEIEYRLLPPRQKEE